MISSGPTVSISWNKRWATADFNPAQSMESKLSQTVGNTPTPITMLALYAIIFAMLLAAVPLVVVYINLIPR